MDPSIVTVIASAHFLTDDELWVIPTHDEWKRPTLVGWVLREKRPWLEHSQLGNLGAKLPKVCTGNESERPPRDCTRRIQDFSRKSCWIILHSFSRRFPSQEFGIRTCARGE